MPASYASLGMGQADLSRLALMLASLSITKQNQDSSQIGGLGTVFILFLWQL